MSNNIPVSKELFEEISLVVMHQRNCSDSNMTTNNVSVSFLVIVKIN
jgi:hypothetical protein